eukprot:m.31006 g.31006  ORF g.31006 m.31006 type:complete len:607 (-) comp8268_c0_seq1:36-1856(-)
MKEKTRCEMESIESEQRVELEEDLTKPENNATEPEVPAQSENAEGDTLTPPEQKENAGGDAPTTSTSTQLHKQTSDSQLQLESDREKSRSVSPTDNGDKQSPKPKRPQSENNILAQCQSEIAEATRLKPVRPPPPARKVLEEKRKSSVMLFEAVVVFSVPPTGGITPKSQFVYVPDNLGVESVLDEAKLGELPRFCFPYHEKATACLKPQSFTFFWPGASLYGFVIQNEPPTPASNIEAICLVTKLEWHAVFKSFTKHLNNIWNKKNWQSVFKSILEKYAIIVRDATQKFDLPPPLEGIKPFSFEKPDLEQLPAQRNLESLAALFQVLGTQNTLDLFASLLFDRRVIVTSSDIGKITDVIFGSISLMYPLVWEHVLIPIMPKHLLDYCLAPMPFVIGIHSSLYAVVKRDPIEQHVLVDLDANTVTCPHNDCALVPPELLGILRAAKKKTKSALTVKEVEHVPGAFFEVFIEILGTCKDYLVRNTNKSARKDGPQLTLDVESYIASKPKSYTQLLRSMTNTQSFTQFIEQQILEATPRPVDSIITDPKFGQFDRQAADYLSKKPGKSSSLARFEKFKVKVRRMRNNRGSENEDEKPPFDGKRLSSPN